MSQENIGFTIVAEGYEPDNFECWAVLKDENSKDLSLQEPGLVYEILEDGEDGCYGIIQSSKKLSERDVISEQLSKQAVSPNEPLTSTIVNLKIHRNSGVSSPVPRSEVKLADEEGIKSAYDLPKEGITAGLFALPSGVPEKTAEVKLHPEFVLGPEAAHINIGGKSGYAKTSWSLFFTKSLLENEEVAKDTAVVAFNVKADDLLYVDHENDEISDEGEEFYERIGIDSTPFTNTEILAPEHPNMEYIPNSIRPDSHVFSFDWLDVQEYIDVLVSPDDHDDTLIALLNDLIQSDTVQDFDTAEATLAGLTNGRGFNDHRRLENEHHSGTASKALRIVGNLRNELGGLLEGNSNSLETESLLKEGKLSVIDIQRLPTKGKRLVMAKLKQEIIEKLEEETAEVENVVFLSDELNKFAPKNADGATKMIKKEIDDISERGRSVGASLLGIEQYPSRVSEGVTGNVSTSVYARMKDSELRNSIYRTMDEKDKEILTDLAKGLVLIDHDTFNQPILTGFPRPPCAQEKPEKYKIYSDIKGFVDPENRETVARVFREDEDEDINDLELVLNEEGQEILEKAREIL